MSVPPLDVRALEEELKAKWNEIMAEETIIDTSGDDGALWENLPVLDSKRVAEFSPIFRRHLGVELDTRLIKPGGYATVQELIDDLVPKMVTAASEATVGPAG